MGIFDRYVDKNGLTKTTREEVKKTSNGYTVGGKTTGSKTQTTNHLRNTQK